MNSLFTHCLILSCTIQHCLCTVYVLKNIKNRSHDTIYTIKNYFAIVFSVFSFQFSATISSIQTDPKSTPHHAPSLPSFIQFINCTTRLEGGLSSYGVTRYPGRFYLGLYSVELLFFLLCCTPFSFGNDIPVCVQKKNSSIVG